MSTAVDIDAMQAGQKMSVGELADRVGTTTANLAVLKTAAPKPVAARGGRCVSAASTR